METSTEKRQVDNYPENRLGERRTYTVTKAADLLGVSRAYAYRLIAEGRFPIPVLRIGARVVVSRGALDKYLDGGDVG